MLEQRAVGADARTIEAEDDSTFSIGAIRLAGVPLPSATPADVEAAFSSINAATAPMGTDPGTIHRSGASRS